MEKKFKFVLSQYLEMVKRGGADQGKIAAAILEHVEKYRELKKVLRAPERAAFFYQVIDQIISKSMEQKNERQISCRKGCAFCCYQNVDISYDEACLLIDNVEIDWEAVEKQAANESNRSKRCVFLKEDNTCGIYEVRPISCRKYFVVSPPNDCNMDDPSNSGRVEVMGVNNAEFISSAIMTASDFGSMATMLLKVRRKIGKE